MRQFLKQSRTKMGVTQKEISQKLKISLRYYYQLEAGAREGKAHIWDSLESIFDVPQRLLRENNTI